MPAARRRDAGGRRGKTVQTDRPGATAGSGFAFNNTRGLVFFFAPLDRRARLGHNRTIRQAGIPAKRFAGRPVNK